MYPYYYFRALAREFDLIALRQIAQHADRHRFMNADPTQKEGEAKQDLADLAHAITRVIALAEDEEN